jgi:hypothetical protein
MVHPPPSLPSRSLPLPPPLLPARLSVSPTRRLVSRALTRLLKRSRTQARASACARGIGRAAGSAYGEKLLVLLCFEPRILRGKVSQAEALGREIGLRTAGDASALPEGGVGTRPGGCRPWRALRRHRRKETAAELKNATDWAAVTGVRKQRYPGSSCLKDSTSQSVDGTRDTTPPSFLALDSSATPTDRIQVAIQ